MRWPNSRSHHDARLRVIEIFSRLCARCGGLDNKLLTDDWPAYREIPEIKHEAITVGPLRPTSCCSVPTASSQTLSAGARVGMSRSLLKFARQVSPVD